MLIPYPKPVIKEFEKNSNNNSKALYGFTISVFCKFCVISNQRPSSTVEFKNNSSQKKILYFLMKMDL